MIEPAMKEIHEIRINQAHNGGFIIHIGCMTFVCGPTRADIRTMMEEIGDYLIDPKVYELTFRKRQRHAADAFHGEERQTCLGGTCGVGNVPAPNRYEEDTLAREPV